MFVVSRENVYSQNHLLAHYAVSWKTSQIYLNLIPNSDYIGVPTKAKIACICA